MDETSTYDKITIRLRSWENSAIEGACDALNGLEKSLLMQEAVFVETCRLGIRWSIRKPPPLTKPWPYQPDREEPGSDFRMAMTASITLAELITRAAEYVNTSRPLFVIGSTLAYIGRLQRCFAAQEAHPDAQKRILANLKRIKLPPQYQYPPSRRK